MLKVYGSAQALSQPNGRAYINILEGHTDGSVGAWTVATQPTYLIQAGYHVYFMQFETDSRAEEWIAEFRTHIVITKIIRLDTDIVENQKG